MLSGILTSIAQFFAWFLSDFLNKFIVSKRGEERTQELGQELTKNAAHEDNAKRKEAADAVLREKTKTGHELVQELRDTANTNGNHIS